MSDLYPSHVPSRGIGAWLRSARDLAMLPVVLAGAVGSLWGEWSS